jgi:hypothetical protein
MQGRLYKHPEEPLEVFLERCAPTSVTDAWWVQLAPSGTGLEGASNWLGEVGRMFSQCNTVPDERTLTRLNQAQLEAKRADIDTLAYHLGKYEILHWES